MENIRHKLRQQLAATEKFGEAELGRILEYFTAKEIPKGAYLVEEGQVEQQVYFVGSGVLRGFFVYEAVEYTTAFTYDGHWCSSYASFINQKPSVYSVQTLSDCILLGIDKASLETCFAFSPLFERFFRKALEQLLSGMEFRERELMASTAEERFSRFMKQSAGLLQTVPQKYIASYLNMTPETFSRLRKNHK